MTPSTRKCAPSSECRIFVALGIKSGCLSAYRRMRVNCLGRRGVPAPAALVWAARPAIRPLSLASSSVTWTVRPSCPSLRPERLALRPHCCHPPILRRSASCRSTLDRDCLKRLNKPLKVEAPNPTTVDKSGPPTDHQLLRTHRSKFCSDRQGSIPAASFHIRPLSGFGCEPPGSDPPTDHIQILGVCRICLSASH